MRRRSALESLLLHVHPAAVPVEALRLGRTLGAGGVAAALLLVAAATGALLLAAYEPSVERAHASVARISAELPLGGLIRGTHRYAGDGALAAALVHLLRVFFQGAWLPPRRANWLLGLALLALLMTASFTGRLLPWDQQGYWAVQTGAALLGELPLAGPGLARLARAGDEVGPRTLALFAGLHEAALPALLFGLLGLHFWRVRAAGGVLLPENACEPRLPASPHLTAREGTAALAAAAGALLLAALVEVPLDRAASPGASPDRALAPWYLAGAQELLLHARPAVAASAPLTLLGLAAALPWIARGARPSGRWFHSDQGFRWALAAALCGGAAVAALVAADEAQRAGAARAWARGAAAVVPALAAAAWGKALLRRPAPRLELAFSAGAFVLGAAFALSATGAALRGPGMALAAVARSVAP